MVESVFSAGRGRSQRTHSHRPAEQSAERVERALFDLMRLFGGMERIANGIQRRLETLGENEIPTKVIGEMVMESLAELDQVAFVRFASVYRNFRETKDFEDFIGELSGGRES